MSGKHPARISSVMGSMVWFIGLVVFLFLQVAPVKAAAAPKRILALYWYNKDFPSNPAFDLSFQAALKSAPAGSIEYYSEYLESDRFPEENQSEVLRDYLRQKYASRSIDVVVAVSDVPLEFLLKYRDSLFPRTPIVFVAIKPPATNEPSGPGLTGIVLGGGYRKTLDLALRLHPGTKQVFIISGTLNHDKTYETLCRKEFQDLDSGVSINYFTDLSLDELIFKTKRLPERSLVLYIWQQLQNEGRLLESADILAAIAPSTTAPIYGVAGWQVGRGVVGGYLRTFETEGTRAGEIALRIANGARAQDIPIESAKKVPMFDWRALKRWGIKETNLPPGSLVLNRQPTAWELYKVYIVSGMTLILVEALLIFGLAWQRGRAKKAEAELAIALDRLRLAVEAGRSVGWDWDLKTGRDRWFGDLETMFGIPSDGYTGHIDDFRRRIYPDDRQVAWQAVADARQNRKPYVAEFRVVRTDGTVRWISARGRFYYSQSGDPERMLGMAVDITERRLTEEALRGSEQRLHLAIQAGRMYAYEWDSSTDMIVRSAEFADVLGTDQPIQTSRRNLTVQVHPDDCERLAAEFTRITPESPASQVQYRLLRPDGGVQWLERRARAFFDDTGKLQRIIGVVADITDRKEAEQALATIGRRLIEAHEEERTWIARELHDDINQRIALLSVELDQYDQHRTSSEVKVPDHLRHVRQRLSELGKDVQALSHRLHSSKLEYLGIEAAAKGFCQEFSEQLKVEIDFSHGGVPHSLSKEISLCLFRVLQEALQNAVKHSGVGRFRVELHGTAGGVQLSVSDLGVGFDAQDAINRRGLGLISMRERLQLVSGELSIKSKPGAGATIIASVPFSPASNSMRAAG
jgi:PAS domain S-box-containing protein